MHINHIATLAAKLGNVSRKDIFELITELCTVENPLLTMEMQSKLYRHFMPKTPNKSKTDFEWVALAVSTDPTRPQLNHVYVDDTGRMIATDGHRMHIAPSEGLEPGFYNNQCVKIDVSDLEFPKIDRVIPKGGNVTTWHRGGKVVAMTPKGESKSINAYVINDEAGVNNRCLDAILQGLTTVEFKSKGLSPMLFDKLEGDRLAVIMPVKLT